MGVDAPALEDPPVIATGKMRAPLALTAALGMLLGCSKPKPPGPTPPPELTLHGVTLSTFRGSQKIAVGRASTLTYERTSGDSVASGARLDFTPAGAPARSRPFRLDADQIQGNALERVADAQGHVTLHGEKGLSGVTPRAHFDGPLKLAEGHDPVQLRGPGYGADAAGFTVLLDRDDFTLQGPVKSWFGGKR